MAITTAPRQEQEPLIDGTVDDRSIINKMIYHAQVHATEPFDAKSSYHSNGDVNQGGSAEINLQKINNIYTSPFFLINSNRQNDVESVYQIWEQFDSIENVLTLRNMNSNSEKKLSLNQFESQSYQEQSQTPQIGFNSHRNSV